METVAAFDFDGTLTTQDSFLPFIRSVHGWTGFLKGGILLPKLMAYGVGLVSRQRMKEAALDFYFKEWSEDELIRCGERFAKHGIPNLLRPEARDVIAWHKQRGHRLILVSASIETYLIPWGRQMGFDAVLASRLLFESGKFTGPLRGNNCWGPEKVRRLEEHLLQEDFELYAYGDTRGDRELLGRADFPFYRRLK